MLAEERFGQILNLLSKQRTATVQELCEALGTSESTIRRDLTELDRLGKLNKVHGGATLPDSRFLADEPTMQAKETLAVPQKRAIAAAAAALIHAEDFVFIDAGSTTLELVRALEGEALQANYVTNGVAHARTLAQKGCRVKATVVHRARESWFLVDDAKFARICPAVIADLHSGAILTNRCPNPKYKQYTLVKETEL